MILRPYQIDLINASRKALISGKKRIVLSAPTGSGKTIMFSYIVQNHILKGGNVLILTHREELLNQAGGAFNKFNIVAKFIQAKNNIDLSGNVHVGMVETINRRIDKLKDFVRNKTLIICDEAHLENFNKLFQYFSETAIVIGATATPLRKSNQACLSDYYEEIIQGVDTAKLIDLGYLAEPYTYGVKINMKGLKKKGDEYDTELYYEQNKIYKGVIENYERLCKDKKTIIFTSSVKSSKSICEEFTRLGYNAKHIDANSKDRKEIFEWYQKTSDGILCNCGIATTGFDQPDIECVILYMATTSLIKMLQCIGRGGRVTEDKKKFFILDFGNNIKRLGFWEDEREWSLYRKEKKSGEAPVKYCPECDAILHTSVMICDYCGYEFVSEQKKVNEKIIKLSLLSKKKLLREDVETKAELCKAKILKPHYVLHNMTNIIDARKFIKLMGYKQGFEYYNKDRFKVFQS